MNKIYHLKPNNLFMEIKFHKCLLRVTRLECDDFTLKFMIYVDLFHSKVALEWIDLNNSISFNSISWIISRTNLFVSFGKNISFLGNSWKISLCCEDHVIASSYS